MTDNHEATEALEEVIAEVKDMDISVEAQAAAVNAAGQMRDRWIEATGAGDDPTRNVSVPNEYVDDSTL